VLDESLSIGSYTKAPVPNPFLSQCTELVSLIEQCLELFSTVDNSLPLTLERLNPKLQQISNLASELLTADEIMKKNNDGMNAGGPGIKMFGNFNPEYSFDDILCSDLKANMRRLVEEVYKAILLKIFVVDFTRCMFRLQQQVTPFLMRASLKYSFNNA